MVFFCGCPAGTGGARLLFLVFKKCFFLGFDARVRLRGLFLVSLAYFFFFCNLLIKRNDRRCIFLVCWYLVLKKRENAGDDAIGLDCNGVTGFCLVTLGFTGFYLVLLGFTWLTGFYLVILVFI